MAASRSTVAGCGKAAAWACVHTLHGHHGKLTAVAAASGNFTASSTWYCEGVRGLRTQQGAAAHAESAKFKLTLKVQQVEVAEESHDDLR